MHKRPIINFSLSYTVANRAIITWMQEIQKAVLVVFVMDTQLHVPAQKTTASIKSPLLSSKVQFQSGSSSLFGMIDTFGFALNVVIIMLASIKLTIAMQESVDSGIGQCSCPWSIMANGGPPFSILSPVCFAVDLFSTLTVVSYNRSGGHPSRLLQLPDKASLSKLPRDVFATADYMLSLCLALLTFLCPQYERN